MEAGGGVAVGGGWRGDGQVGLCGVGVVSEVGRWWRCGWGVYLGGTAADSVVACGPVGGCPGAVMVGGECLQVGRDRLGRGGLYLLPPKRKSWWGLMALLL